MGMYNLLDKNKVRHMVQMNVDIIYWTKRSKALDKDNVDEDTPMKMILSLSEARV